MNARPDLRCVCAACMYTPCKDVGGTCWGEVVSVGATLNGVVCPSTLALDSLLSRIREDGTGSCLAGSVHNSKNSRVHTKAGVGRQGEGEGKAPRLHLDALHRHKQLKEPRPDWPIWNRSTLIVPFCSVQIEVLIKIGKFLCEVTGTRLVASDTTLLTLAQKQASCSPARVLIVCTACPS